MEAQKTQKVVYQPIEDAYKSLYFTVTYRGSGAVLVRLDVGTTSSLEYKVNQGNIATSTNYPTLFLAELYRDKPENQFGGDTTEARRNNLWFPAGDTVSLSDAATNVSATYGDTWY